MKASSGEVKIDYHQLSSVLQVTDNFVIVIDRIKSKTDDLTTFLQAYEAIIDKLVFEMCLGGFNLGPVAKRSGIRLYI